MVSTCKFGSVLLGYAIHYFWDGGSNKTVVVMHKPNECGTHLIHWKPLHEHAQDAQVRVVTERCICKSLMSTLNAHVFFLPTRIWELRRVGFWNSEFSFLSISSLLSILSITPLSEILYKKIGKEFSYQYVIIYPYLVTKLWSGCNAVLSNIWA